jgi:hypothetical protein
MSGPEALDYASPEPFSKELNRLRTLAVSHFVAGGFLFAIGIVPLCGLIIFTASALSDEDPGGSVLGIGIFLFFLIATMGTGLGLIFSGRRLRQCRGWDFSYNVALISLLYPPFGTILAIFTLEILCREKVRSLYKRYEAEEKPGDADSRG